MIDVSSSTKITNDLPLVANVNDMQHTAATAASQQAAQQAAATPTGFRLESGFAVSVFGDDHLIAFVFLPGDISRMVVPD